MIMDGQVLECDRCGLVFFEAEVRTDCDTCGPVALCLGCHEFHLGEIAVERAADNRDLEGEAGG